MGLMGKSKAFALNIVGNPLWQKVGDHFLTSVLKEYYVSVYPHCFFFCPRDHICPASSTVLQIKSQAFLEDVLSNAYR